MGLIYVFDIDDTLYDLDDFSYEDLLYDERLVNNLDAIPQNIPKYILTNAHSSHAIKVLNILKLKHHFKGIFARDLMPEMKPHPRCYEHVTQSIMGRENINDRNDINILFFDDLSNNLESAHRAGWRTCWINKYDKYDKYTTFVELLAKKKSRYIFNKYDYKFRNINEALEHLQKLNSYVCNENDCMLI